MSFLYETLFKIGSISLKVAHNFLLFLVALFLKNVPPKTIHRLFVDYRSFIIAFILVPISFLYDQIARIRSWIGWWFFRTNVVHDIKVKNIQNQVLEWKKSGSTKKMCTSRGIAQSMSLRLSSFKRNCHQIDINLHDIIEVDIKKKIIRVEPNVNMGQITELLNKIGWTLAVTIEMEDLTVGGLLMGMGVENNSHIYGFIHETCSAYEIVTGDGEFLRCTEKENSDLFRALPSSHGTLGFLVAAELKIIPCKPWLKVNYIPCKNQDELYEKLVNLTINRETCPEFVEALVYSRTESVIFTANFSDEPTGSERNKINRVNLWFKPWFHKHVETFLKKGNDYEYVPIRDWFHRYTRSIFWELEDLVPFANHPIYRYTWGILGAPKVSLIKSFHTKEIRNDLIYKHVIQDMTLPLKHLKEAIDLSDNLFGVYPQLIYPARMFPHDPEGIIRNPRELINNDPNEGEMYFDLGIYGVPKCVKQGQKYDGPNVIRNLDKFARDRAGFLWVYTDVFATEEEFMQTFNFDLWQKCRQKYNADKAFPTVWEKIKPDFSTFMD